MPIEPIGAAETPQLNICAAASTFVHPSSSEPNWGNSISNGFHKGHRLDSYSVQWPYKNHTADTSSCDIVSFEISSCDIVSFDIYRSLRKPPKENLKNFKTWGCGSWGRGSWGGGSWNRGSWCPGSWGRGSWGPGVMGSWGPGVLELEETSNLWEHQASTQTGASV